MASTHYPHIKIAIVGPESSGKTTLAQDLVETLDYTLVREYARDYFAQKGSPEYQLQDIVNIAKGQLALENASASPIVCDTTLLVCKIWAEVRFNHCPSWIRKHYSSQHYTHHFLTTPDIPWEPDPLRENPHDRDWLFSLYQNDLEKTQSAYTIISGSQEERLRTALATLSSI